MIANPAATVSPARRLAAIVAGVLPLGLFLNTLYYWYWPDGLARSVPDVALFLGAVAGAAGIVWRWNRLRPAEPWRRRTRLGGAVLAVYAGLLWLDPLGPRAHVFAPEACEFEVAFPGRPDRTAIFAAVGDRQVGVGRRAVLGLPGITSSFGAECLTVAGVAEAGLAEGQADARRQLQEAMRQAGFSIRALSVEPADPRRLELVAAAELRDAENRRIVRLIDMQVRLGRRSILRVWHVAMALEAEPSRAAAAPFFERVARRR